MVAIIFSGCPSSAPRLGLQLTTENWQLTTVLLHLLYGLATQRGDFGLVAKLDESVEGGLDDVVRVGGAERLGEHVLHAGRGHHGTNGLAGDDSGTFRGRLEHHRSCTV